MSRRLLLLGTALCVGSALLAADRPAERRFDIAYTAALHNIPKGARKVALWVPYPGSDDHQEISDIRVICPYPTRVTRDLVYGNKVLYLEVDNPRDPSLELEISFNVKREEYVRRDLDKRKATAPSAHFSAHDLRADHLVPLSDRIRRLGLKVTAGRSTDLDRARAIYDYVVDTMKYDKSGTGWGNGDILWACDAKRGNCTDFHALFIGLCRAAGIPARFSIGFPLPEARGGGEIPGYHCWAEFFLKGFGWVPVDASEAAKHPEKRGYFFGAHDENRVQLSRGRDIVLNPRQAGPPLNYFVYPYAEVDGAPFKNVTKKFTFRDRSETRAEMSLRPTTIPTIGRKGALE